MEKEKRSKKMVILEMIVRGSGMYSKCDTIDEMIEVTIAIPADGPSFGVAPSGT